MRSLPPLEDTSVSNVLGWTVYHVGNVPSTNETARGLPPWTAVVAESQSAGYGRFHREFVSDKGGLWLSAVCAAPGGSANWLGFPLVVGLKLLGALEHLGIPGTRLRWPNDIMVNARKLGGLLVEEDASGHLIVGLGLNITNAPWASNPSLWTGTTRLADLLARPPSPLALLEPVLTAIANAHHCMSMGGLAAASNELNEKWSDRRPVEIMLHDSRMLQGKFAGIDASGQVHLEDAHGRIQSIPAHHVERLIEIP